MQPGMPRWRPLRRPWRWPKWSGCVLLAVWIQSRRPCRALCRWKSPKIAAFAAAYLERRGDGRLELYEEMKQLYDYRSKAVHGATTSDALLHAHVLKVRHILSRLVCKITEEGALPSLADFEAALFS